jgi:hypothetical protein
MTTGAEAHPPEQAAPQRRPRGPDRHRGHVPAHPRDAEEGGGERVFLFCFSCVRLTDCEREKRKKRGREGEGRRSCTTDPRDAEEGGGERLASFLISTNTATASSPAPDPLPQNLSFFNFFINDLQQVNDNFVYEFQLFVTELRDFFNAGSLTRLLEGVRSGMDEPSLALIDQFLLAKKKADTVSPFYLVTKWVFKLKKKEKRRKERRRGGLACGRGGGSGEGGQRENEKESNK